MKKIYLYSILLFNVFFCVNLFGQEKRVEQADKEFENFRFIDAREAYLNVVEKGYVSQNIYEKLGDSYYFNADLPEASDWYSRLYSEFKASMKPEYYFRYSQSLKSLRNYEEADKIMLEFDQITGEGERRVKLFKEERDYLKLIELQSGRFNINSLPINASGSDFGPSFYKEDQLVFASAREEGGTKLIHEWNEAPFLDLYVTSRKGKESMEVQGMERVKGKVNTKFHESSTVFTKDGKTMYFTRNNFTDKKKETNSKGITLLKLYKATKKDGKWSDITELPFNSDEYSVAHPALSADEKKLYFASDMPGTEGVSDLYVVDIKGDNEYGEPKNLGKTINTEARETFPFISKSGMLFFASDGHIGLGGLDVFVARPLEEEDSFNDPFNVGKPINSPQDDFSFIVDDETKVGFFTSNRPGGKGDDDIYSFIQTKELITGCNQYLSGNVSDAETRQKLKGAKVTLLDSDMKELASVESGPEGEYSLPIDCNENYVIRASREGYKFTEIDFATTNEFELKHNQPIQLSKGGELGVIKAGVGDDLGKLLQLDPIYFDLDKSFIRPDAEVELQKVIAIMNQNPAMTIDVRSHTDSRASFDYNMRLSERRNKSTIDYLVNKGKIDRSRLTGRGYGEANLVNECTDGVECSEEKHQLNRRSEFIILKQ